MTAQDRVFAKCAWRLIPFMGLLYLINYIDRTNVGFAALTMNADLGFAPAVFGFGAGIFYVGYALFQVPGQSDPRTYRRETLGLLHFGDMGSVVGLERVR